MLSVAGGHRKRQVPAAGYFWPNIHPRLQGDAVGCFISPLCARFNRFFVYKVIFVVDQSVYYRLSRAASTVSIVLAPATPGTPGGVRHWSDSRRALAAGSFQRPLPQ
ncbi:hypothetical protein FGX74_10120 [Pseudomonas aeruginosa]|nr:hypothetical protein [Pseudomonas aeruginosa]NHY21752.1 hypothetical protein [Pseudomonas aeruginosa]NHY41579.1 hypothetical protein [Pseudomonas aeruginosa]